MDFGSDESGGIHAIHPLSANFEGRLDDVGGTFRLDEVKARHRFGLKLGTYLPQIDTWSVDVGALPISTVALRLDQVFSRNGKRIPGAEARRLLGLRTDQLVGVLPFSKDDLINDLWGIGAKELVAFASGYDFFFPPSYSLWDGSPPAHWLYSTKRRFVMFDDLSAAGVRTAPVVAFQGLAEVEQLAEWIAENPIVDLVSVDLQTHASSSRAMPLQADLLHEFDRLTAKRLEYLVNGPRKERSVAQVLGALDGRRVTFTNATLACPVDRFGAGFVAVAHPGDTRQLLPRIGLQKAIVARAAERKSYAAANAA